MTILTLFIQAIRAFACLPAGGCIAKIN